MRPLLFLTLLLNWAVAFGQQKVLLLPGIRPNPQMDIGPYSVFYEDRSGDTLLPVAIQTKVFRPFLQQPTDNYPTQKVVVKWLRFTLQNSSPTHSLAYWLHVGRHPVMWLYALDALNRPSLLATTGGNVLARLLPTSAPYRMAVPIVLRPRQQQTYLLGVNTFQSRDPLQITLHTPLAYRAFLNDFHREQLPAFTFYTGLIACLVFMGMFSLAQYLTNRDIIYAWYSLYVLATCLYFFRIAELYFQLDWWLPNQPLLRLASLPLSELAIQFFYLLFFGTLLELPRYQPRLWQGYRYLLAIVAFFFVVTVGSVLFWNSSALLRVHSGKWANLTIMLLLVSSLLLAGLALRGRHALWTYAFIGLVLLMAGAAGTLALNRIRVPGVTPDSLFLQMPSLLFGSSVLLEVFCFSLALGRRTRLIEIEKKQIQQQYAQDLETQLAQRTQEVQQQSRRLEAQHIQQLQTEFDQKLADTEMTALRAQMNPHFIFNCLNSIKLYTLQNDTDRAADYLTKFAQLIRLVLENSRADRIPLQNELEALQLYSDLEAMRFKQKVRIHLHIDPDIDQQEVTIPPLLLQPYVENAIWHGLMHKPEGGTVTVKVSQPTDACLHVEVIDDGVGRARAGELQSKSAGKTKSFGMQVTADRIRMINELYNTQTQARIFDLVAPNGDPLGTKVVLEIPI
jgi:hypothetical protein